MAPPLCLRTPCPAAFLPMPHQAITTVDPFPLKRARIVRSAGSNNQRHLRPTSLSLLCFLQLQVQEASIQLSVSATPQPEATMDQQHQQGLDAAAARRMATLASHLRPHPASPPQVSHRAPPCLSPTFRLVWFFLRIRGTPAVRLDSLHRRTPTRLSTRTS